MELLIETPGKVKRVLKLIIPKYAISNREKENKSSTNKNVIVSNETMEVLVVIQTNRILLGMIPDYNAISFNLLREWDLAYHQYGNILDCIYLPHSLSLAIISSSSLIIIIPIQSTINRAFMSVCLPVKPIRLLEIMHEKHLDHMLDSLIVQCERQTSIHISMTKDGLLPDIGEFNLNAVLHKPIDAITQQLCVDNNYIYLYSTDRSTGDLSINQWLIKDMQKDSMFFLHHGNCSLTERKINIGLHLNLIDCIVFTHRGLTTLIFAAEPSTNQNTNRSIHSMHQNVGDGGVIMTLQSNMIINQQPLALSPKGIRRAGLNTVWIHYVQDNAKPTASSIYECWDVNYFVILKKVTVSIPHPSTCWILPSMESQDPLIRPCTVIVANESSSENVIRRDTPDIVSTMIYRYTLLTNDEVAAMADENVGSLSQMIGSHFHKLTSAVQRLSDIVDETDEVLDRLSDIKKRKLLEAKQSYDLLIEVEKQSSDDDHYDTDRKSKEINNKKQKMSHITSPDLSKEFLDEFERSVVKLSGGVLHHRQDWTLVKVFLRDGSLSMSAYPSILRHILRSGRLDVIMELVRYCQDLSESDCMDILLHIITNCHFVQSKYSIIQGMIYLKGEDPTENVANSLEESSKSSGAVIKQTQKKSKRTEKGSVPSNVTTILVPMTTESSNSLQITPQLQHLDMVRVVLEGILSRPATYTNMLLSDAIKTKMDFSVAIFIMRILIMILQGVSTKSTLSSTIHLGSLEDNHLQHAIVWMEAIIDAHFTSFSLQAIHNPQVRKVLIHAMEIVKEADEALTRMETVTGYLNHILRSIKFRKDHPLTKRSVGIYEVIQLKI